MYEYVDGQGQRVTVRSARTLGALLLDGRITGNTKFRRAEEPAFVPAGEHGELGRIAAEHGVWLAPLPEPVAEQPDNPVAETPALPDKPQLPPAPAALAVAGSAQTQPPVPMARSSRAQSPQAPRSRWWLPDPDPPIPRSPSASGPWSGPSSPGCPASSADKGPPGAPVPKAMGVPGPSAVTMFMPARPPPESGAARTVRRVGISLLYHGAAALGAGATAAAALLVSRSFPFATLVLVGAAAAAATFAGRRMGQLRLVPPNWEAAAGGVLFGAVACGVAGWVGFLLSGATGLILWRALRKHSALPPPV